MIVARLGMYKRGPSLLDLGPFLRPNASESSRTRFGGSPVCENGEYRKFCFQEEPFSAARWIEVKRSLVSDTGYAGDSQCYADKGTSGVGQMVYVMRQEGSTEGEQLNAQSFH